MSGIVYNTAYTTDTGTSRYSTAPVTDTGTSTFGSPGNTASVDTSGSYGTASYSTGTCTGSVATSGNATGPVDTAIHDKSHQKDAS